MAGKKLIYAATGFIGTLAELQAEYGDSLDPFLVFKWEDLEEHRMMGECDAIIADKLPLASDTIQ